MNDQQSPVRGLVAGKYEVLQLIGRGGMGTVWEGRHSTLGTRVAIKFVDPEYADSQEARTRFVTEARAAATIQSKHAIQIYDHGVTDDGRPYIVMELLVGEPLDRRIERLGRLAPIDTARILCQVCRALQRAHDAGIIHRDLKPENIFLVRSPDDDEEIAKVLDFGIAKFRGPPGGAGMSSSTKTGAVLGTPYYMSPEQARGLRNIDQRTDLWSLGVIAFKCVTGSLPFDGESVGDLLVKICTATPPPPSRAMPGLPPSFDSWFARALEREPERRFQSASELADALAMATGLSQRRAVSQNGFPQYASPSSQSHPQPMSGGVMLAGAVTSSPFTASASVPKSSRGVVFGVGLAIVVGASLGVIIVAKFVSPTNAGTTGAGVSAAPSDPGLGASAPHPGPLANNQVVLALPSSPPPPPSAPPAASSVAAPPPAPPPPAVHTASKPPYSPPKPVVPTAAPVASAAKPPPSTSPAPPPPPPKPVQADPGY
jgi:serine/threonine-protein kinase